MHVLLKHNRGDPPGLSLSRKSRLPRGLRLCLSVRPGTSLALTLLFDANLSPKLVKRLAELFRDATHVFDTGLEKFTSDESTWTYSATNGFTIVTADADFVRLAEKRVHPPRVFWLENCNYKTAVVEELLRRHAIRIADLEPSARPILIIRNGA